MFSHLFIPIINIECSNTFTQAASYAETYFDFGTQCYQFIHLKTDQTITVTESQLPKKHWFHITLKIVSMILSLGIFPLAMFIIKCLYRFHHPLFIDHPPFSSTSSTSSTSSNNRPFLNHEKQRPSKAFSSMLTTKVSPPLSLENHPTAILYKIFTEFFSSSEFLQYTILNKHFNAMINDDLMRWESLHKKMIKGCSPQELKAFIQRVKVQYTQGREPSYKQKVQYLCQELWEDAKQIPDIQKIIRDEKLSMGDLMTTNQYERFRILLQPIRDQNILTMTKDLLEQNKPLQENFNQFLSKTNQNNDLKITNIREWFNSEEINQDLINVIELKLCTSSIVSMEMVGYMMRMINLKELNLNDNAFSTLPKAIGNLNQLQELSLCNNRLSTLPDSIGNLSQLNLLRLGHNQLSHLPESIGNLNQLQRIDLQFNQLSFLPKSIGNLNQLCWLDLFENKLLMLPESIGNLSQLNTLNLNINKLSALPESIGNLSKLNTLTLSVNKVSAFPNSINKLKQLKVLEFENNKISLFERRKVRKLLPEANMKM